MGTATEERAAVAVVLRSVVPSKWTVYPWRPVTEVLPCVTIEPRSPFQERGPAFRGRSLGLRLLTYWAVITLGPLLVGASLSATYLAVRESLNALSLDIAADALLGVLPFLFTCGALVLLYGVVPADPWSLVTGTVPEGYRLSAPVEVAPVAADPARSAHAHVLAGAGAWPRDAADLRVIGNVRARTGRHIDSQEEVGGWPALAAGRPEPDADGDGMPDAWERRHGLDPARADGHADRNGDGMTNLEDWLAERAAAVLR